MDVQEAVRQHDQAAVRRARLRHKNRFELRGVVNGCSDQVPWMNIAAASGIACVLLAKTLTSATFKRVEDWFDVPLAMRA
jgi:hypothetical protein